MSLCNNNIILSAQEMKKLDGVLIVVSAIAIVISLIFMVISFFINKIDYAIYFGVLVIILQNYIKE